MRVPARYWLGLITNPPNKWSINLAFSTWLDVIKSAKSVIVPSESHIISHSYNPPQLGCNALHSPLHPPTTVQLSSNQHTTRCLMIRCGSKMNALARYEHYIIACSRVGWPEL